MLGCGETKFAGILWYLYRRNLKTLYSNYIKNSFMPIKNSERITENNVVLYTHLKTRFERTLALLEDENGFKLVSGDLKTGEF